MAGGGGVSAHARPNSTEVAAVVSGGTMDMTELCNVLAAELPRRLPPGVFGQVGLVIALGHSAK